jgi:hypothetical protein
MITGAQPKVLLNMDENGNLIMDENFLELMGKGKNYKLVREHDNLTNYSTDVMWIEWDEDGHFKAKHDTIEIGRSLIMSPFNETFTWQTTDVTEIIDNSENFIKFKTKNSVYTLTKEK